MQGSKIIALSNLGRNLHATANTVSDSQLRSLKIAGALAVALHLLLALLLPDIPKLIIPNIDRGSSSITVFLRRTPEPEPFKQTLNVPGLTQSLNTNEPQASVSIASQAGEADSLSDAAPEQESVREDDRQSRASGSQDQAAVSPSVFITRSAIQLFSKQEAFLHAERNPQELQRFNRSFNSRASLRRRPKTDSFNNIFGDYYVRSSASDGDICFLQQKQAEQDEYKTNLVVFFRCDKKPLDFSIEK